MGKTLGTFIPKSKFIVRSNSLQKSVKKLDQEKKIKSEPKQSTHICYVVILKFLTEVISRT